ncbi:MAG: methyl-accepting chemotaxis protein [Nevskia sp.]|nr:methyl-accepting chemotaxis protein [Nevskia sp.]
MRLKQRLLMLGIAGVLAAMTIGLVGWGGQRLLLDSAAQQAVAAKAVREQMRVDMMHDAVNSDVLAALLAAGNKADAARFTEIRQGLDEHVGIIQQSLAVLLEMPLDEGLHAQLGSVGPRVKAYAAEATAIVELAARDAMAANARLPKFNAAFTALEDALAEFGDGIEGLIARQGVAGEAVGHNVTLVQVGSLMVLAALLGWLSLAVTRRIMAQLGADPGDASAVVQRIANGQLDQDIDVRSCPAGSVMAAMAKMQDELRSRAAAAAESAGQLAAINRSQGVIEFALDGTIERANDNLLKMFGYTLADVAGKPHSTLCDTAEVAHPDYIAHWNRLRRGDFVSGRFRRIARDGRTVWLEASYNTLLDAAGKPVRVIKYARDISNEVAAETEVARIVEAAANGDFTQRISLDGKEGVFLKLAQSINQLMETSSVGLGEVVRVLGALARADLTENISAEYRGTFGQLKLDSNQTVAQLAQIITTIKQATETIHTASREIAAGNQDLSSRTEQQAASLEETASSMEELTSTVRQNADSARQANQLARGAAEIAVKGGQVVSDVVTTMSEINDSSKKIVDIISVIDGIAFQTNILALNAAVEAARAGEQGRGFAVVASEVRSLAQRSASAAKEIKVLIGDSVEKVGNGTKLVQQAGRTMDEVVGSVNQVTEIVSAISAASEEQSSGIEQINQAITQMDEVTQQNAALVEQAAASARALEQQAETLAHTVSVFVLDTAQHKPMAESAGAAVAGPAIRPAVSSSRPKPVPRRPNAAAATPALRKANGARAGGDVWNEF